MANMRKVLLLLLKTGFSAFKGQRRLALENLALRQQLSMLARSNKRPRISPFDRLFWAFFSKHVADWRAMLHVLHPDTVVRWHRNGFRYLQGAGDDVGDVPSEFAEGGRVPFVRQLIGDPGGDLGDSGKIIDGIVACRDIRESQVKK